MLLYVSLSCIIMQNQARSQDFLKGGYVDVYVCICKKQGCKTRGGLGGRSPGKFLEIRCSEIVSGAIFGQKQSRSSYYFI